MQDNKVKLKEFYNQNIDYWEKYPREDVRKQYLEMLDLSDISKNSVLNILDIGCGSSRDAIRLSEILRDNRFSHFKGIGIDFSCKALEIAKKKDIENWTFFDGDFLDDDLKDINENDFDIVICSMVVMHYQDLNEVFNRLSSFLNEKGKLLLVTNKPYLVSYEYGISYQNQNDYEHEFDINPNGQKVKIDKYLHTLPTYFHAAKNAGLALDSYTEILSYNDDASLYNKKENNKLDFPNFIAMLFNRI